MPKTLRIVLLNPPMETNIGHIPYSLAILGEYVRKHADCGHDIEIIDARLFPADIDEIYRLLLGKSPDLIGITCLTISASFVYALTRKIKEQHPGILLVHGGPHVTAMPELSWQSGCDYAVIGEGELTFTELVNRVSAGVLPDGIAGIGYGRQGQFIRTPDRELIQDLDSCPIPDYSPYDLTCYDETIHVNAEPCAFIMFSRGCAYHCAYCVAPLMWRRKVRFKSVENVLAEMDVFSETYGYRNFHFFDDDFLFDAPRAVELARTIQARQRNWQWVIQSRCASVIRHRQVLPVLRAAGCLAIELGIESISDDVLKNIRKDQTGAEAIATMQLILKENMIPLPLLMTCNAGETLDSFYLTNRTFSRLPAHPRMKWCESFTTPFPGTTYHAQLDRYGILLSREWSHFHPNKLNFIPHSLGSDRPLRLKEELSDHDCTILDQFIRQLGLATPERSYLNLVLSKADGRRTVLEHIFSAEPDILPNDGDSLQTKQLVLRIIIILAWLGIVRSASSTIDVVPVDQLWLSNFASQEYSRGQEQAD